MPVLKDKNKILPMHFFGKAEGYNWSHDPFSDPLERLMTKNNKPKRIYPKKKKSNG